METYPYVIVGGGVVAGYAAKEFAEHIQYHHGDLAIITADDISPTIAHLFPKISYRAMNSGVILKMLMKSSNLEISRRKELVFGVLKIIK